MNDKKLILIVEDDVALLEILSEGLALDEFEVCQAKNGQEGLEVAFQRKPDLILLDLIMPRMDGVTMLDNLRADEWAKRVPVIVLTNLSSPEEVDKIAQKGVSGYLVKSNWKIEEIIKKIRQILK